MRVEPAGIQVAEVGGGDAPPEQVVLPADGPGGRNIGEEGGNEDGGNDGGV